MHDEHATACGFGLVRRRATLYYGAMEGLIAGRTPGDMPGLDIAEQKSWQSFLDCGLRLYATLNRRITDQHQLSLTDVRVLDVLGNAASGSARMGDLAEALASLPSRLTRQIGRLEAQGLVRRGASPDDRRGVVASITDDGRTAWRQAMQTYGQGVRTYYLGQLSRTQMMAMGENCRRITAGLKRSDRAAKLG
jgi:DNA-binding MarR family transcriptional regulator